jgi:hypothetical protein
MSAEEVIEQDVRFRAERLSRVMTSLGERLIRLARELDRDPLDARINSLGEIQFEGSTIDAGCGGYMAAKQALRTVLTGTPSEDT